MQLDLRYPIGFLLTAFGAILVVQGLIGRATVLGLNVNLDWGAFMVACGIGALYSARRTNRSSGGRRTSGTSG